MKKIILMVVMVVSSIPLSWRAAWCKAEQSPAPAQTQPQTAQPAAPANADMQSRQDENDNLNQNIDKQINQKKVDKFIEEMGKFIRTNPKTFAQDENNALKIINSINLNDEEYIEVQKIISEQIDLRYFAGGLGPVDKNNYNDFVKYHIFYIAKNYPLGQWAKKLTEEEIIMTKIMPIIENPNINERLKTGWMGELSNLLLMKIYNKRLPFSDKNCIKVMDELIKIFSDKKNSLDFRTYAAMAWINGERRENEKYLVFDILIKDEEVFEKIGRNLWHIRKNAPKIYEKMFTILEDREKYSDKIINGALEFYKRDSMEFRDDKENKRKIRIKRVLKNMSKEKNRNYQKNVEGILQHIEEKYNGDGCSCSIIR